jgi:hypothetical protein
MMADVLLMGLVVAFLAMILLGLMIQHSLAQARQGLTGLALDLNAFQHDLAEIGMRLQRLEHMAHWPDAPLPASSSERRLN